MCDLFPVGDASEAGLLHSFRISKHQSWKPWKGRIASVVHHWWCHSLQEAFLHYSWPDSPKPNSFQCIAARLRQALAVHDQETARNACLAIFRWGGVRGRKSLAWVEDQYQQKTLCQSIIQAVQLLQPGSAQGLAAFDGKRLLMNSAMTKVYAAADPDHIIIYDGRVGAALGLLARYSLMRAGVTSVPADLSFRWGAGQGDTTNRDPSLGAFKFSKLNAAQCQLWAGLDRDLYHVRAYGLDGEGEVDLRAGGAAGGQPVGDIAAGGWRIPLLGLNRHNRCGSSPRQASS